MSPAPYLAELPPSPWNCEHAEKAVRARTIAGGRVRAELQCLRCGRSIRAVKAAGNLSDFPPWDERLAEEFEAQARRKIERREQQAEAEREAESREWWAEYNEYLRTPVWHAKRKKVMERAGGMCEGCGNRWADQVHHLTYETYNQYKGEEFLFELVALCVSCHERLHEIRRERRR